MSILKRQTMKKTHLKLLGLLTMGALVGSTAAYAADEALLDTLVKKGYLTQQEATTIKKDTVVVKPEQSTTKGLTVSGLIQTQYEWIGYKNHVKNDIASPTASNPVSSPSINPDGSFGPVNTSFDVNSKSNPASTNRFLMRRVYLGVDAQLGDGFSAFLNGQFHTDNSTNAAGAASLETGYIQKEFDADYFTGNLRVGYQKVPFGMEEITNSGHLLAIERSPVTHYFSGSLSQERVGGSAVYGPTGNGNTGFGGRHTGIYWHGNADQLTEGLSYDVAVVNGNQDIDFGLSHPSNRLGFFAGVDYANSWDKVNYSFGLNGGFKTGNNTAASWWSGSHSKNNYMAGLNPYAEMTWESLTVQVEAFWSYIEEGRSPLTAGQVAGTAKLDAARPVGFNAFVAYRLTDEWELVARWSGLATDKRGVTIAGAIPGASDIPLVSTTNDTTISPGVVTNFGTLFNNVNSIYLGVNYYIMGDSVKVQAGYDFSRFTGRYGQNATTGAFKGNAAVVHSARVQMQLML